MPRDVLKAMEREKVTGLTAVPPLYIQLTQIEAGVDRYAPARQLPGRPDAGETRMPAAYPRSPSDVW